MLRTSRVTNQPYEMVKKLSSMRIVIRIWFIDIIIDLKKIVMIKL